MHILVVQSSPPNPGSLSRGLVDEVAEHVRATGDHIFKFRDLGRNPLDHVNAAFVQHRHDVDDPALRLSDEIIDEWRWADLVILGAPMHNLSVSSILKAYIDHLLRADASVKVIPDPAHPLGYRMEGLLGGTRVFVVLSRGGHYGSPEGRKWDFQKPYLEAILGYTGVELDFVALEGPTPEDYARTAAAARETIRTHTWLNN